MRHARFFDLVLKGIIRDYTEIIMRYFRALYWGSFRSLKGLIRDSGLPGGMTMGQGISASAPDHEEGLPCASSLAACVDVVSDSDDDCRILVMPVQPSLVKTRQRENHFLTSIYAQKHGFRKHISFRT